MKIFDEQVSRKPDMYSWTDDFMSKAESVHGSKYDYSKVEYINSKTPINIICPKHGVFSQRSSHHLNGSGCRKCANEIRSQKYSFKLDDHSKEWVMNNYGNKSMKECAKHLNIDVKTFRKVVKNLGLEDIRKVNRIHEHIDNFYWERLKNGAESRLLEFDITPEYVWNILEDQNFKCVLSGQPINFNGRSNTTASVDRIDSKKGYIEGNIQLLHKKVNKLKSNLCDDELIYWCKQISKYN